MATNLDHYIQPAIDQYLALNNTDVEKRPEGIPSSPHYDAGLITWHVAYWMGINEIRSVSTSRGHSYNVTLRGGRTFSARITDYGDYRNGVQGIRY